jgi:lysophospholipase L1-like esterase
MSDLCVLTASLLVQGKVPGWKPVTPPTNFWEALVNQRSAVDRLCGSNTAPNPITPVASAHRPEFSNWAKEISTRQPSKPASGSQLYAQRMAALRTGQLYTRLPADSFRPIWQTAAYHPTYEDWVNLLSYEARAVAQGQGSQRLTVLLGDSIAQWFPSEQLSRDRFWLNQGISGDTTGGVLQRLSILDGTNPDSIYLMVGINDLRRGVSNREILRNLRQIIHRIRASHPYTRIYIHSILPTRLEEIPVNRIRRLNYNIAALTEQEGVHFVNLQPAFSDEDGHLQPQLTTDGLHLNAKGYQMWKLAIAPVF